MPKYLKISLILSSALTLILLGLFFIPPPSSSVAASTDPKVSGYAWSENIGWIDFSPTNGGVSLDGGGNLSGYAWSDNIGWIKFGGLSGFPAIPSSLSSGLAAHFKSNEGSGTTATDSSGNNDNGTWSGTGTHYSTGKVGSYAGQFNGSDDYVDAGNPANLDIRTAGTVGMWFKPSSNGASWSSIVSKGNFSTDRDGFIIALTPNTNRFMVELADASGYQQIYSTANLTLDTWHYGVVTWDSTTVKLYVDGVMVHSESETKVPVSNVYNLTIGRAAGYAAYFKGLIDEVVIYNRAITSDEASTLYNGGAGTDIDSLPSDTSSSKNAQISSGNIIGWARACGGMYDVSLNQTTPNNSCSGTSRTDGWDGWISLSGSNYGVSFNNNNFSGYAWGSDVFGWIDFSPAFGGGVKLEASPIALSLSANPLTIPMASSSILTWSATGADSCTINKGGSLWKTITPVYAYASQLGSFGSGNGQFKSPQGITFDSSGNIYIADYNNNRVQKFDSSGNYLSQFGSAGSGNGQFNRPYGVALDASGNIYVTDSSNNRVQKFNSSGTYLSQFGSSGSGNGQFSNPMGIAIDSSGNIYVVDGFNSRVQKFNSSGTYLSQFGSNGPGNGQFYDPRNIAFDSSGNIYVTDFIIHAVEKFNSSGTYLLQFDNSYFNGGNPLSGANGISTDSSGNVFVSDYKNNLVYKFNSSGVYQSQLVGGGLSNPAGIAVDSSKNVYVVDNGTNRIKKFTPSISDSADSGNLNATTTFAMTCTNSSNSATTSVTINVSSPVPTLNLRAVPSDIIWTTMDATTCTLSTSTPFNVGTIGDYYEELLPANIKFTLSCVGPGGASSTSVYSVGPAPKSTCTVSQSSIIVNPLSSSLVSHWKLNEGSGATAADSSGGNDGTLNLANWTTGKIGGALSFNNSGVHGIVNLGSPASLQLQTMTLSAWVKRSVFGTHDAIFSGAYGGYIFFFLSGDNHLFFGKTGIAGEVHSNATITDTNWHHVAVTYDGANASFYIDGSLSGNPAFSQSFDPVEVAIGDRPDGDGMPFDGSVDEVAIWNRVLSSDEILALYNKGAGTEMNSIVSGDNSLYANRNTKWTITNPAGTVSNVTWSGTNFPSATTTVGNILNVIYKTVGTKTISITGTVNATTPFTTICSTSTMIKLDVGSNQEV